ncbi:MAG: hypothetical protein ND895_07825 [Pyrinomonadaceae bacterium]|nr:hypothetical protein [Pyrinomonadaceae bacterium]
MKTETICRETTCGPSSGERPRYYARQLITSDDLTLEQEYFRNRLRLHNRMLHGWGVVCGAKVCLLPKAGENGNGKRFEPWMVVVKPGYALDPCGNEIHIDCARPVDLRKRDGVNGVTGEPCVEAMDPWCVEVFDEQAADELYVAVRYKQYATRPVRVQPTGCGCDDTHCENSRWRDGYEIRILDYCPDTHTDRPDLETLGHGPNPECPPCHPDDAWVVLARVTVAEDGAVQIDNCQCRRLVLSLQDFWWECDNPVRATKVAEFGPNEERNKYLDVLADKLKEEAEAEGVIIAYVPKVGDATDFFGEAKKYLQETRGIRAERITFSEGTHRTKMVVELWLVPKGAEKPTPSAEGTVVEDEPASDETEPEPRAKRPRIKRGKSK